MRKIILPFSKTYLKRYSNTRRLFLLLLLACIMLLPALFFGMELCDSGFYATFYDQIFARPDSVAYNFMYYMSGVAGGVVSAVTGGSLLWLRVAGLLTCLICVACSARIYNDPSYNFGLIAAILVICTGAWQSPLSIYNDNMTAALACMSLTCLSESLFTESERRAIIYCCIAAGLAGFNTLTRLPNVLEILFILLIPTAVKDRQKMLRLALVWIGGWLAGLVLALVLAYGLGHLSLLEDVIKDLFVMGSSSDSESTHSLKSLISVQISCWVEIVILMIKLMVAGGIGLYLSRKIKSIPLRIIIAIAFTAPCLYWMITGNIVTVTAAISLAGIICTFHKGFTPRQATPAIAGFLMMIILPLGSDNGIYNAGTIVLWLAAPAGFNYVKRVYGKTIGWIVCLAIVGAGGYKAAAGAFYFDDTPLIDMTETVNNDRASYIHTSPLKAQRLTEILDTLNTHVNSGDTMLVYGSAPMINHLTRTVPALGCSWPELLTPAMLTSKLDTSPKPEYILLMRFNTLGGKWGEPSDQYLNGTDKNQNRFHNKDKSGVIREFIKRNNYIIVCREKDFILFKTPAPTKKPGN
ncbi:MAG: hypothetical protein HDS16_07315 [Bacteroides sp.]|nr:hypothetical protein [Bacteroides sp.]